MKKLLFLVLILSPFFVSSQEKSGHNYYWNDYEEHVAIIGANNCYVREKPSIQSQLLDSLQIGKKIKVLKASDENGVNTDLQIKGLNVSWAEIEYLNNNGKQVKGYLWKGFIAVGFFTTEKFTYLTTIDRVDKKVETEQYEPELFSVSIKVLDLNNSIVGQRTIKKEIGESHYFQNKAIGNLGLKGLENIYRISFSGEACGIPTLYYYHGWNGKNFLELPEKYDISDAGVYYHSEDFIFPKENGGKQDVILKKVEEGQYDEDSFTNNNYVTHVTKWTETFKWDGQKAVFISKSKPVKSRRKESN